MNSFSFVSGWSFELKRWMNSVDNCSTIVCIYTKSFRSNFFTESGIRLNVRTSSAYLNIWCNMKWNGKLSIIYGLVRVSSWLAAESTTKTVNVSWSWSANIVHVLSNNLNSFMTGASCKWRKTSSEEKEAWATAVLDKHPRDKK